MNKEAIFTTQETNPPSETEYQGRHLSIIGGGIAGLATGYYARKYKLPFCIYEADEQIGGNCRTIRQGEFLFDTGAHRLYDRDAEVTNAFKELLGDDLQKIDVPNQILFQNKRIDFPLSPLNLLEGLGAWKIACASVDLLRARLFKPAHLESFEDYAIYNYGRTIADCFLLGYSEKLWGAPASKLSPDINGKKLNGLSLRTFAFDAWEGSGSKTEHLDGTFYYPKFGIGTMMNRIGAACGAENIHLRSRITRVLHDDRKITYIEVNNKALVAVKDLISTLPLTTLLGLLNPEPPEEIQMLVKRIRYRNVILVALFLNRQQVTPNASLYFPDPDLPFTRGYEPKNRSASMSPADKTSFVVEIPCDDKKLFRDVEHETLIRTISNMLVKQGLIQQQHIIGGAVHFIPFAYPVLEIGFESLISQISNYLSSFSNLSLAGRSGTFANKHMHEIMIEGRQLVKDLAVLHPIGNMSSSSLN